MDVIRFTHGATGPLKGFGASGVSFVPLADGTGDTHLSCLHLEEGARVNAPSITHAAALLIVHGRITFTTHLEARIQFSGGIGAVFGPKEPYTVESATGSAPTNSVTSCPTFTDKSSVYHVCRESS